MSPAKMDLEESNSKQIKKKNPNKKRRSNREKSGSQSHRSTAAAKVTHMLIKGVGVFKRSGNKKINKEITKL